jgi:hypothetical protein
MQDKAREQRRQRRIEKTKKKRENVSRPAAGGPARQMDPEKGKSWATGECFVTLGWDEPGAALDLLFSRARPDGTSVLAHFEIDRGGPGLVSARAVGGLRREHVAGECGRISERKGTTLVACSPGLVAALVHEAAAQGTNPAPRGFREAAALLEGVPLGTVGVPFGPVERAPAAKPDGWFGRVRRSLFGG